MQDFRYVGLDISLKQRALGDIHFCFLSQLAYNSEILSKFVPKFSGDKHKSLQVDTERTFHQRYPLVML